MTDALPPQNLAMEQAVLGACILEPSRIEEVCEVLDHGDFYRASHGLIWQVIVGLHRRNEPVDLLTVQTDLQRLNGLEACGGAPYLLDLCDAPPALANAAHYGAVVAEMARRREVIAASRHVHDAAHDLDVPLADVTDATDKIAVREARGANHAIPIGDLMYDVLTSARRRAERPGLAGITTGIPEVDECLDGLTRGDMFIIAARPSVGKTAIALQLAAVASGCPEKWVPLLFSAEMGPAQIALRTAAYATGIGQGRIKRGELSGVEWDRLADAVRSCSELPYKVVDASGMKPSGIEAHIRRVRPDLVIVDYLQIVVPEDRRENRNVDVGDIAKTLKILARRYACAMVVLCQLSRAIESRADHEPNLADLRESGDIEAAADIVWFLSPSTEFAEGAVVLNMKIAKNRNGPLLKGKLHFDGATNTFTYRGY